MTRTLLPALLALCACANPPPPRPAPASSPARGTGPAQGDALRELVELSELVAVGTVERRLDEAGGTVYEVLVREVLRRRPADGEADSHPRKVGTRLRVSSFLFRPARPPASIRPLEELSRYVLFLSPAERAGEWLHLADPAAYRLPEAQPTLEELRRSAPDPGPSPRTTTSPGG